MAKEKSDQVYDSTAGKVAIGATGVAITAGVVALGAALMADDKTRAKIVKDAQNMLSNLRQVVESIKSEGQETYKTLKDLSKEEK